VISCIIPTRNRGDAFVRALQSCLDQTVDCEIVVSDHASTDGTEDYVRDLKDDRVIYIRQDESINITWNWLLGLMVSHGDLIKYVFDDDYLEPQCCETLADLIADDHLVSVRSDVRVDRAARLQRLAARHADPRCRPSGCPLRVPCDGADRPEGSPVRVGSHAATISASL